MSCWPEWKESLDNGLVLPDTLPPRVEVLVGMIRNNGTNNAKILEFQPMEKVIELLRGKYNIIFTFCCPSADT